MEEIEIMEYEKKLLLKRLPHCQNPKEMMRVTNWIRQYGDRIRGENVLNKKQK